MPIKTLHISAFKQINLIFAFNSSISVKTNVFSPKKLRRFQTKKNLSQKQTNRPCRKNTNEIYFFCTKIRNLIKKIRRTNEKLDKFGKISSKIKTFKVFLSYCTYFQWRRTNVEKFDHFTDISRILYNKFIFNVERAADELNFNIIINTINEI